MDTLHLISVSGEFLAMGTCVAGANPFLMIAITVLIAGSGVLTFASGVTTITVAGVLIKLIIAGATIEEIIAVLTGASFGSTVVMSVDGLATLIIAIRQLLGC